MFKIVLLWLPVCMVRLQPWTKMTKPDRIIVCLDGVAQDELRKTMIIQAVLQEYMSTLFLLRKIIELFTTPVLLPRQCFCLRPSRYASY